MKVRANILCLCGVVVGLVALLQPWWVITDTQHFTGEVDIYERSSQRILDEIAVGTIDEIALALGVYVFAAGFAISLWTPIGGFLQIAGVAAYLTVGYVAFFETVSSITTSVVHEPGIGVLLGSVAGALVVVSYAHPVFIGTKKQDGDEDLNSLTWSIARRKGSRAIPGP